MSIGPFENPVKYPSCNFAHLKPLKILQHGIKQKLKTLVSCEMSTEMYSNICSCKVSSSQLAEKATSASVKNSFENWDEKLIPQKF